MQKVLIFLLLIQLSFFSNGQDKYKPELWIQANGKAGFLIAHRSVMAHLVKDHVYAGEIGVVFQTRGRKKWNHAYKYPRIALNAYVGTLGNAEQLGNSFAVNSTVSMPLIKAKWYEFSLKTGVGLAFMDKVYDVKTNPLGIAMSTHLNVMVTLGAESRFKLSNKSALTLSLDAVHFSNGATKVPNFGLNIPFLSLGYQHKLTDSRWENKSKERLELTSISSAQNLKRWEFGAMFIGSVKEVFPINQKKYGVLGLNIVGRRFFNQKVGMEMSFDIMANESIKMFHADVEKSFDEIIQLGIYAGYILPLDRFHAIVGMGFYVRNKYQPDGIMYHRLGVRYVLKNGINFNVTLKSHWAKADYVEYGIGYTFKKSKKR